MADTHFDSNILKRVMLHSDKDTGIVLLSTLVGLCFVIYNKYYCTSNNENIQRDDRTVYLMELVKKIGDSFLPPQ